MAALGSLVAEIGLDSFKFEQGVNRSIDSVGELGRTVDSAANSTLAGFGKQLDVVGLSADKTAVSFRSLGKSADFDKLMASIDALTESVEKQSTGWRSTLGALGAFSTGVKSSIDVFEKFGGVAPKWTKDFDAAKTKFGEVSKTVTDFAKNLTANNAKATEASAAIGAVGKEAEVTGGRFNAAIPAVGGFVAALAPLLIVGAAVAVVVTAVKAAVASASDVASGSVPGFGAARGAMEDYANALRDAAKSSNDFALKFGYTVTQATTFIELGARLKISADDGASGIQKLTDAISESPEKFKELGISLKNADGTARAFNDVAVDVQKTLSEYATEADRASVANELFGGTTGQLSAAIKLSSAEYEKQNALLRQYGLLLGKDSVDAADKFTKAQNDFTYNAELTLRSLKNTISGVFLPVLTDMFEAFTGGWPKVAQAFRDGAVWIADKMYGLRAAILGTVDDIQWKWEKLKLTLSAGVDMASAAKNFDGKGIVAAYDTLQAQIAAIDRSALKQREAREIEYADRIRKLRELGTGAGPQDVPGKKRAPKKEENEDEAKSVDDLMLAYQRLIANIGERTTAEAALLDGGTKLTEGQKFSLGILKELTSSKHQYTEEQKISIAKSLEEMLRLEALNKAAKAFAEGQATINKALNQETETYLKGIDDQQAALDALFKSLDAENEKLNEEVKALGLTNAARDIYNINLAREKALKLAMSQSDVDRINKLYDEKIAIVGVKQAHEDNLSALERYKQIESGIEDFFVDLFNNGRDAFSNLGNTIKQFFTKLAAQFATKFVLNIVAGGASGGLGGIASALGFGGGGEGIGGSLGAISLMNGGSSIGTAIGVFDSVLAGTGSVLEGLTAGLSSLTGGATAFLGVLGPIGLAVGAIFALWKAFGADEKGFKFDNSLLTGDNRKGIISSSLGNFDFAGDFENKLVEPFISAINRIDDVFAKDLFNAQTLADVKDQIQNLVNPDWYGGNSEEEIKANIEAASKQFLQARYGVAFDALEAGAGNLVRGFTGTADELIQYIVKLQGAAVAIEKLNKIVPGLNLSLAGFAALSDSAREAVAVLAVSIDAFATDTNKAVEDYIEASTRGVVASYELQAAKLAEMRDQLADGTIGIETFASGITALATAYASATAKIAETKTALAELFGNTQEGFFLQTLGVEQKYKYFQDQAEALFAALGAATDPETIDRLARQIDALQNSAFGLLSDADKTALSGQFISGSKAVEELVLQRLQAAGDALDKQNNNLKTVIADALADFAAQIKETADLDRETALIDRDTALTPRQLEITVKNDGNVEVRGNV